MTDEQINRAIAEACGWMDFSQHPDWGTMAIDPNTHKLRTMIPNYCTDLNAMADAEKSLRSEQWQLYAAWLFKATGRPQAATARQRAEAFLRTLGKWEATDKESLTVQSTTEESSVDQKEVQP